MSDLSAEDFLARLRALRDERDAVEQDIRALVEEAATAGCNLPLYVTRAFNGPAKTSNQAQARKAVETEIGHIYAVAVDGGLLKIGFSLNPTRRVSEIKADYRLQTVDLLGSVPGRVGTERRLHNAVRSHAAFEFRRPSMEFYHPTDFMKSTVAWLMGLGEDADTFIRHFIRPLREKAQDTSPLPYWTAKRAQRGAVQ